MSKEPKAEKTKPSADALPDPRVLWLGETAHLDGQCPCRVVLAWVWSKASDKSDWVVKAEHVYEVARGNDRMNKPRFSSESLDGLPSAFFEDVIDAFDRANETKRGA